MSMLTKFTPLLFVLLAACASDKGQVGEEAFKCQAVSTEKLQRNQISPLGFSPAQILSFSEGTYAGSLQWADAQESELTITTQFTGVANYLVREWIDEDGEMSTQQLTLDCSNVLSLEMVVTMGSTDGRLDESWTLHMLAPSSSKASFTQVPEQFNGNLDISTFAPAGDFIQRRAFVDVVFQGENVSGTLTGLSEISSENNDSDDVTSGISFAIGFFDF